MSDYWRAEFYPVDKTLARAVRRLWPSPAALLREMGSWLADNDELEIRPWRGRDPGRAASASPCGHRWAVKAVAGADGRDPPPDRGQISRYTGKNYEGGLPR